MDRFAAMIILLGTLVVSVLECAQKNVPFF